MRCGRLRRRARRLLGRPVTWRRLVGGAMLMTLVLGCGWLALWPFTSPTHCPTRDGLTELLDPTCQLYREGRIAGGLCAPLCLDHLIRPNGCAAVTDHTIAVPVRCDGACRPGLAVDAQLKVGHADLAMREMASGREQFAEEDGAQDYPSALQLLALNRVSHFLQALPFNDSDILKVVWGQRVKGHAISRQQANGVWRSMTSLLRQKEFVMGRVFGHLRLFPAIYGSCGPLYVQESCEASPWLPVEGREEAEWTEGRGGVEWEWEEGRVGVGLAEKRGGAKRVSRRRELPWRVAASHALQVLRTVERLHTALPEPLYLCGLSANHLGLCSDGSLRVLHLDHAFFKSAAVSLHKTQCQLDRDCLWNHCLATCDVSRARCHIHDYYNLQAVCRAVFQRGWSYSGGLLDHPPPQVSARLRHSLLACISSYQHGGQPVLDDLVRVLNTSLHGNTLWQDRY